MILPPGSRAGRDEIAQPPGTTDTAGLDEPSDPRRDMPFSDPPLMSADGLGSRLEFETLIADTSASLFAAAPDQIDRVVERALDHVRQFFQVDRCALLSTSPDQQVATIRMASYAEGLAHVPSDLNMAELFPWSYHTLVVERLPVRVSTIADLPPEADCEREAWIGMGTRSALMLPIETEGSVRYLFVFNAVHQEREWPAPFVSRLRVLGQMLVGALERQASFAAIREAEERLSLAADSAQAGLWTLNLRTGVFWVTNRARAMFGFAPDEVVDMARFQAAVHPEDWETVWEGIQRAMRERQCVDVDYRITRSDQGGVRWIAGRGQPRLDPSGDTELLMGSCIDVTERRHAEDALRRSETRYATAAELDGLGYYEVDFDKGTCFVDDRYCDLSGLPADRQQGLQPLEFWQERLHPDDRTRILDFRRRLHDGTVPTGVIEYRFLHPTQGERWFVHTARVADRDSSGRAIRTYGVVRDITASKRAEEALRQSYEEIERLKDRLQAESDYLKAEIRVVLDQSEITGDSAAIKKVLHQAAQVAPTDSSVLIRGETGTGKELIAQAIHRQSHRAGHVMVKVNCAALPSGLVESELFGREKGAFTGALSRQVGRFELADRSTIFLDEIGELPLDVQAKLLRVLQDGEFERLGSPRTIKVNLRVIAATNRDLAEEVRNGRFREDLFYRLNVFPIHVPPLRERVEDIPPLVWAFVEEFSSRMGKNITQVPRATMEALERRHWSGNVRELRNLIEYAAIITTGNTLKVPMLGEAASVADLSQSLADVERKHIVRTLEHTRWQIKGPEGAAAALGLHPATLYHRMKKLGIRQPDDRSS